VSLRRRKALAVQPEIMVPDWGVKELIICQAHP
jgi:hypothetical protein